MVFGGIPEMFPKLKIGYLEVGCGWLPYWAERMDEEWEKRGKVEAPLCKKKPSEYLFSENSYYGCEPEEKMISYVTKQIGSKTLMYASDYPALGHELAGIGDHSVESRRHFARRQKGSLAQQR